MIETRRVQVQLMQVFIIVGCVLVGLTGHGGSSGEHSGSAPPGNTPVTPGTLWSKARRRRVVKPPVSAMLDGLQPSSTPQAVARRLGARKTPV